MGRRQRRHTPPEKKSAIGVYVRNQAIKALQDMRDKKIATMVTFGVTVEDVVDTMFNSETQAILRKAKGVVNEGTFHFGGNKFEIFPGCKVVLQEKGFNKLGLAAPDEAAVNVDWGHPKMVAFTQAVRETLEIIDDFHVAETVIKWLDKHTGRRTFRYYFPAIKQLVPDLDVELVERIIPPDNLSKYLPAIRASATLIAAGAMLPDPPEIEPTLQLQFASGTQFVRDGISYSRDTVYINI